MSHFNVFSIGLFCPIKLAHIEMSDKSVVNLKMPAECLEYLKHITNKFISVGMEPPIEISNLEDRIRQFPQIQTMITELFANNN